MITESLVVTGLAVLLLLIQMVNGMVARRNDKHTASELVKLRLEVEAGRSGTDQLLEMHRHFDQDGTPLWYVPRSWSGTQSHIVEICQQISNSQVLLVQAIERMEDRLNKL